MKEPLNIEKTAGGPSAPGSLRFADVIFPTKAPMIFLKNPNAVIGEGSSN
jgi:hypothetical protein